MRDRATPIGAAANQYAVGDTAGIITEGVVYVTVSGAVTAGAPAWHITNNLSVMWMPNLVRNNALSDISAPLAEARGVDLAVAAGAHAKVAGIEELLVELLERAGATPSKPAG